MPSTRTAMLPALVVAAASCVVAVAVVAVWHRRRVTSAWRRRLAVVTSDARRLRHASAIAGEDDTTAASICRSVLRLAGERAALGLLPSCSRRRHRARVAVERAADEHVRRLSHLVDAADAG